MCTLRATGVREAAREPSPMVPNWGPSGSSPQAVETDFLDVSHGFRPGRGAHGALDSLWKRTMDMGGGRIVDVDLGQFYDTIDKGLSGDSSSVGCAMA